MALEPTSADPYLPTSPLVFPDGFLWGTSNAAHQVEGGNVNNDWWAWEHDPASPCVEPSGDATDAWNRYAEDLDLCARGGGQNLHRFSVEWSRVEPAEGEFSQAALDHYKAVADACGERGLTPMVTFHHFTTPLWATRAGSWTDDAIVDRFARFCERVAAALGPDRLLFACTINEPSIVSTLGYFLGQFPPGVRDLDAAAKATANLIRAHVGALEAIKGVAPDCMTGISLAMSEVAAHDTADEPAVNLADLMRTRMIDVYVDALRTGEVRGLGPAVEDFAIDGIVGTSDFVGCQYYQRTVLNPSAPGGMFLEPEPPESEMTQMGYAVYPPGLGSSLHRLNEIGLPVIITENGRCTDDDRRRSAWIAAHLAVAHQAMLDGVDLFGYVYWSTTDNFEWAFGYGPQFGLIGIDRENALARVPRPSLDFFDEIACTNTLDPKLVDEFVHAPG